MTKHPHDPDDSDVEPGYGGEDQTHHHQGPGVDPAYGGEESLHVHHQHGEHVDPSCGGDESGGARERTEQEEVGPRGDGDA